MFHITGINFKDLKITDDVFSIFKNQNKNKFEQNSNKTDIAFHCLF